MKRPTVLFVCTGNSCGSQMAEALLRAQAGSSFEVLSAGLQPQGVHPLTLQVLQERGIDTSVLSSKSLFDFIGKVTPDYLITVCGAAERDCPVVWPGETTRLHWPFEDPAKFTGSEEHVLDEFRRVRDEISLHVTAWLLRSPLGAGAIT